MSAWAKPGVKVVCIVDACRAINSRGFPLFKKGEIYTIRAVDNDPRYGLFLSFLECSPLHTGHIVGFRPLITRTQEQDLAIFRPLLDRLPIREDAL